MVSTTASATRQKYGRGYSIHIPAKVAEELGLESKHVTFEVKVITLNGEKVIILKPLSK